MDDTEDDAGYPPNPSSSSYYASSHRNQRRFKLPVSLRRIPRNYYEGKNHRNEYEEEDGDNGDGGNYPKRRKYHDSNGSEDEVEEDDVDGDDDGNIIRRSVHAGDDDGDDEDGEDDDDEDEDEDDDGSGRYRRSNSNDDVGPRGKRPIDRFEFAPRVKALAPVPVPTPPAAARPSVGGARGSPIADWSENSTFVLLDAWGERFLQLGRKSLRSEDWLDVAKQVSESSRAGRTEVQCRNRLDTLKKKYKKEKMRILESGGGTSKWVYFKRMEELMEGSPPPRQQPGLACGVDSGEYVFMNPNVYLNTANGLDEMRDSPGNSENYEDNDNDSDEVPPKRARLVSEDEGGGLSSSSSFRLLANSIQKFGEIYEKMENNKRQQMMELEKMRMEFHRDLERQKRQILEQAQAEIAKIRQGDDDEEMDASAENMSE